MASNSKKEERDSNGLNFTEIYHNDTYETIKPTKLNLKGRYILVSGASKGIGRCTALAYAKAGASGIAIAARSDLSSLQEEMKKAASDAGKREPEVLQIKIDVKDRSSIEKAAEQVSSAFPHVDIIVNNAGVLEDFKPLLETDPDEWWNTWEVNVRGPYLINRSFLPLLLKSPNPEKTVVVVSSLGAHFTEPGGSAYESTKRAVLHTTQFINVEYGEQGVLAYCVHPGSVLTELASALPERIKWRLIDKPELPGDTICFLTAERREWLAGRYIAVNWDMEEFFSKRQEIIDRDLLKFRMAV